MTAKDDENLEALGVVDRQSRVGRTAMQVGVPTAIVGVVTYLARLAHLDLDPGPGADMPADVVGYLIAIVTVGISYTMNRGTPDDT